MRQIIKKTQKSNSAPVLHACAARLPLSNIPRKYFVRSCTERPRHEKGERTTGLPEKVAVKVV